ncbi:MAG: hypothetical protein ABJD68_02990, partial [Nakamurella sp.]
MMRLCASGTTGAAAGVAVVAAGDVACGETASGAGTSAATAAGDVAKAEDWLTGAEMTSAAGEVPSALADGICCATEDVTEGWTAADTRSGCAEEVAANEKMVNEIV